MQPAHSIGQTPSGVSGFHPGEASDVRSAGTAAASRPAQQREETRLPPAAQYMARTSTAQRFAAFPPAAAALGHQAHARAAAAAPAGRMQHVLRRIRSLVPEPAKAGSKEEVAEQRRYLELCKELSAQTGGSIPPGFELAHRGYDEARTVKDRLHILKELNDALAQELERGPAPAAEGAAPPDEPTAAAGERRQAAELAAAMDQEQRKYMGLATKLHEMGEADMPPAIAKESKAYAQAATAAEKLAIMQKANRILELEIDEVADARKVAQQIEQDVADGTAKELATVQNTYAQLIQKAHELQRPEGGHRFDAIHNEYALRYDRAASDEERVAILKEAGVSLSAEIRRVAERPGTSYAKRNPGNSAAAYASGKPDLQRLWQANRALAAYLHSREDSDASSTDSPADRMAKSDWDNGTGA